LRGGLPDLLQRIDGDAITNERVLGADGDSKGIEGDRQFVELDACLLAFLDFRLQDRTRAV
jgi:hypothetical protein